MTAIIKEDEFSRYFDLVIDLWPSQLTLDAMDRDAQQRPDGSWLHRTYLAIRTELYENVEDWDLQVGVSLTSAIYEFLCIKSEGQFGVTLSREFIDKTAVMDIMDQYPTWSVLRRESYRSRGFWG
jgi:hypothetical protein